MKKISNYAANRQVNLYDGFNESTKYKIPERMLELEQLMVTIGMEMFEVLVNDGEVKTQKKIGEKKTREISRGQIYRDWKKELLIPQGNNI